MNANQIEKNTAWLLQNGSPPVRYLTHKYLLNERVHSKVMIDLWTEVQACPDVVEIFSAQREDGGWVAPRCAEEHQWNRSCPFASYAGALALYSAHEQTYQPALKRALEFLVWHLSTKQPEEIQRFFYHGHSTIHELLMFTELQVGLDQKPVQLLLEWLMRMVHAEEGHFKYIGKPVSQYARRKDGMDARVAKYRLYHLMEDDWLTYYGTRIGANLIT